MVAVPVHYAQDKAAAVHREREKIVVARGVGNVAYDRPAIGESH